MESLGNMPQVLKAQASDRIAAGALLCAHEYGLNNISCRIVGELTGLSETSVRSYTRSNDGLMCLAVSEAIATRVYPVVVLSGLLCKSPAAEILDEETKRAIWRAAEIEFFQPADD